MRPRPRATGLVAALAVVLAAYLLVFGGAFWNRSGEPSSELGLTERELPLPISVDDREGSVVVLDVELTHQVPFWERQLQNFEPAGRSQRCTNTSLSCSCSQRRLDLVRLAMHPGASSSMNLSEKQRKHLRGLAHGRDPLVLIVQAGLSQAVAAEFETAINAHELIKVRARVGDREQRDEIFERLAVASHSTLVQRIGNIGVLYRRHKDKPRIILPAD